MSEHCVKVYLKEPEDSEFDEFFEAVQELADELIDAVQEHKAGEYDGDEFGPGECILFLYGPDADRLFEAIKKPLLASPLARGGYVIKRYGPPEEDVKEVRIDL